MNDRLDILAIIISIVTVLYTIYVDYKTSSFNKKTSRENAMSAFFMELYFNILTTELPELIKSFHSGNEREERIKILDDIDNTIISILDKSLFYKYYDSKFYEEAKSKIMEFQDLIFHTSDYIDRGTYRNDTHGMKIDSCISDLYKSMINYYSSI